MPRQPANRMENKTATTTRESNPLPPSLPPPFLLLGLCTECACVCVAQRQQKCFPARRKFRRQLSARFRWGWLGSSGGSYNNSRGGSSSAVHAVHVFLAFHSLFPHFSFSQNLSNAFDFAYRDCLPRCRCFWGLLCVVGVIEGRARAGRGGEVDGGGLAMASAKLKLTFRERRHNEMRHRQRQRGQGEKRRHAI